MNRRNFFTRVATAIAIAPVVKLVAKPTEPKPPVEPLVLKERQSRTWLVLGRAGYGKTTLGLALAPALRDTFGCWPSVFYNEHWSPDRAGELMDQIMGERNKGRDVIIEARLSRGAGATELHNMQAPMQLAVLADWSFAIIGKMVHIDDKIGYLRCWHVETLADRFGNKPKRFFFAQRNEGPVGWVPGDTLDDCWFGPTRSIAELA